MIVPNSRDESKGEPIGKETEGLEKAIQIKKRSVVISGHPTSISLETAFWLALKETADRNGQTVNQLVSLIDDERTGNLSSAIRVHILKEVQRRCK